MNQDVLKKQAAVAALDFIEPGMILGVGTGSTVDHLIALLPKIKNKLEGAVASSNATAKQLKALGIPLFDLNSVDDLPLYIDGADEVNHSKQMIKGGGGAQTSEKIIASIAKKFVCIVDQTKVVDLLGSFPVAIEVIPLARSFVARQLVQLGGDPVYRTGFLTDHQQIILDVHNLKMLNPRELEIQINQLVGVVENGIFAKRTADVVLVGTEKNVITL